MNGKRFSRKIAFWTLIPASGYLALTFVLLRQNSNRSGRYWDLISTPGSLIMKLLGMSGGFEVGIIVAAVLNLFVYGLAGYILGCTAERLSSAKTGKI